MHIIKDFTAQQHLILAEFSTSYVGNNDTLQSIL